MAYFLNAVYFLLLALATPWLVYAAIVKKKYRQGIVNRLFGLVPKRLGDRPCIWIHAVSVGEINLLVALLPHLRQMLPDCDIAISSTTRTGYELARARFVGHKTFYCPLDFTWAVDRAMKRIRPSLLVLTELEVWPNLISSARRRRIPVAIVNGRLSRSSWRGYRRLRPFMRRVLRNIDLIAVQTDQYARRFQDLGVPPRRLTITGSLKFDGVTGDRENRTTRRLARLAGLNDDDIVLLAGSTQEPEERMALEAFQALADRYPQLRLLIVPRHPERFETVARILDQSGCRWQRRSRLKQPDPEKPNAETPSRILMVDTVGELSAWWGVTDIAFVGGSMGRRGGQNMIEPAAYGCAVCFGPNTANFKDVVDQMLAANAAVRVSNQSDLTEFVSRCVSRSSYRQELGSRARKLVLENRGATRTTVELLYCLIQAGGGTRHDQSSVKPTVKGLHFDKESRRRGNSRSIGHRP